MGPILRTARFGFMAVPNPMDLAGLLNANALYSFATGILQLMFGCFLVKEKGASIERVLPMSVSFVSLVLCLANVLFDFAAVLCELKGEQQEANRIWEKWSRSSQEQKDRAEKKNVAALAKIEAHFSKLEQSHHNMMSKKDAMREERSKFSLELDEIDEGVQDLVRKELMAYKKNLQEKKKLMAGGGVDLASLRQDKAGGRAQNLAATRRDMWNLKESQIEERFNEEMGKIPVEDPEFGSKIQKLQAERDLKMKAIKDAQKAEAGTTDKQTSIPAELRAAHSLQEPLLSPPSFIKSTPTPQRSSTRQM